MAHPNGHQVEYQDVPEYQMDQMDYQMEDWEGGIANEVTLDDVSYSILFEI